MGFISNIKIGKRLGLGFALILAMTVLIACAGIWRLSEVADATRTMMAAPLSKERLITDWYSLNFASIRRTAAIVKSTDPALGPYFKEDAAASVKKAAELLKGIEPLIAGDAEKALFAKILEQRKHYSASRDGAVKAKADGNEAEAARLLDEKFTPAAKLYQDLLQELVVMQRTSIDATAKAIDASAARSTTIIALLTAAAVLLGAILSWLLTKGITRPIQDALELAETVAGGDLTRDINATSKDETGALLRALRHMNDSLVKIVTQVRSGTDTIATASAEISAGNLDLSSRTEQQAGALEETAASMEELTTTVRQNADNARQANQLSIAASEVAAQGGAVVGQVITTMGSINESSRKIVDIIGVIDGIAFQTNILALNAAVEAARAGEQGRGFAVVASEVRNLAQRSAAAAKEIKVLIGDSVDKVDVGAKLVDQAGATMEQVVSSIRRVTDIMAEITHASTEQTGGIEQVNQAIGQMDQVTQQNAALVEEAAAAAASMQDQAATLAQVVGVFKLAGPALPAPAVRATPATPAAPVRAIARPAPALRVSRTAPLKSPARVDADEWETF
ncbi:MULTISPECIES: methyl-accepting chemotaxis protein [unclassified Massilia]|uniref:methyl-accepting chemotaxis protein n=1 Tax=unclassified Massilia TaxID=2609279 RepID=UPI001787245C|nr:MULTISPECIES: methyl-accepting chemotaxis protein [unclassified Massilia]MBD8530367.1 MCP four helix bundle domain-containing protein [Massilia sp. CFBP 13647]MBD8673144.1 MCP four helix bundle domain-containing protein [Massilia sp. CFBP 13721]